MENLAVEPSSILITGAAGAIGSALAAEYAGSGVHLHLGDRTGTSLDLVADECRRRGAQAWTDFGDVRQPDRMSDWVHQADARAPLDLIVLLAGVSHGDLERDETPEQTREVFGVNLDGMLNVLLPALRLFRERRRGQVALMSSLAGTRGLPHAPSYSATKAAVRVYGEALRLRLRREQVGVSVINPGFIESPMTRSNRFPMPFLVTTEKAAKVIRRGLARDQGQIAFPWPMALGAWLLSTVHSRVFQFFAAPRGSRPGPPTAS